jgi:hypothetical protein
MIFVTVNILKFYSNHLINFRNNSELGSTWASVLFPLPFANKWCLVLVWQDFMFACGQVSFLLRSKYRLANQSIPPGTPL